MYGAILGDMIGAPYEFDRGDKTKDFPLFSRGSQYTDDSVMTLAVAEALLSLDDNASDDEVHDAVITSMQKWGKKYPHAGYGGRFRGWLFSHRKPEPYGSYGNGSAMRVSSVGWLYDTLEDTRRYAKLTAEVTHNHPEGIKGAEATAAAIFLARHGVTKDEIRDYIVSEFHYDLSRTCDEIRPTYHHVESCQETVPEAITAFLEGENFEDVIRTAVSLGGDCDTLTCIAGSIAESYYGVPEELKEECRRRLTEELRQVLEAFDREMVFKATASDDPFLNGNEMITEAIAEYFKDSTKETLTAVLDAIRQRMHADGHFIVPVAVSDDQSQVALQKLSTADDKIWYAVFTSKQEYEKGEPSQVISHFIDATLEFCRNAGEETAGIVIDPWGENHFLLTNELMDMIFEADAGVEYHVPDDPITAELLEDGSFLKRAAKICSDNPTQLNIIKLARILRDSNVWVPCNEIISDEDYAKVEKLVKAAEEGDRLDSLIGTELPIENEVRFVPDILQNDNGFFFPVFTSEEEMGEYGKNFSKVSCHFLEAINLAKNNQKDVLGIVINAFTEPYVFPRELFELVEGMDSSLEDAEQDLG